MSHWHVNAWAGQHWHPAAWLTALAPEAGQAHYHIYRRARLSGAETLVAQAAGSWNQIGLIVGANVDAYYRVAAVSRQGTEDADPVRLLHVRTDGLGVLLAPLPNKPSELRLSQGSGGKVTAAWIYAAAGQDVAPAEFRVYTANGDAALNLAAAAATIAYDGGRGFSADLGAFADGTRLRAVVGAVSAAGQEALERREASISVVIAAQPIEAGDVEVSVA